MKLVFSFICFNVFFAASAFASFFVVEQDDCFSQSKQEQLSHNCEIKLSPEEHKALLDEFSAAAALVALKRTQKKSLKDKLRHNGVCLLKITKTGKEKLRRKMKSLRKSMGSRTLSETRILLACKKIISTLEENSLESVIFTSKKLTRECFGDSFRTDQRKKFAQLLRVLFDAGLMCRVRARGQAPTFEYYPAEKLISLLKS